MRILRSSAILDSFAIHEVRYDAPRRTLSVWFLGNRRPYHYLDVPEEVYEELLHSDSAGNYFNQHIRHHYGFLH